VLLHVYHPAHEADVVIDLLRMARHGPGAAQPLSTAYGCVKFERTTAGRSSRLVSSDGYCLVEKVCQLCPVRTAGRSKPRSK
jgi:hypothetical protein